MLRSACSMPIIFLLVACATPAPTAAPTAAAPGIGWRKGLVVEIGDGAALGPPIDGDCRGSASSGADPRQRYVEVRYFVGRHAHLRIVPIDDALRVAAGDAIWFRSVGCVDARLAAPDR